MGSDRARVSYDPERKYNAVVALMGRVALEADINESAAISNEEQRQEALEIVGPWGTPDNGFKIQKAGTGLSHDFISTAGTMYIGGERIYAFDDITYSTQSEWIDRDSDPTYVKPDASAGKTNELIYLYVEEVEVSAVEDTALLESALGGPDTSGRARLIARLKRFGTNESTCEKALADASAAWSTGGMALDLNTMRLLSLETLEVAFADGGGTTSECEPPSVAGYVGADNQLIRVRVVTDPQTGSTGLLWGYDNASVMYRIDTTTDSKTVTLHQAPLDQKHWPRAAQWVEVLRSAAQLYTGSEVLGEARSFWDYVASATGDLTTVASVAKPFDPDQLQLMLTDSVSFTSNPSAMPPAYLRMWEGKLDSIVLNTPVNLVDATGSGIGINVTLNTVHPGDTLRDGDFWLIGLRPNQSNAVYPERIKDLPQRADGPRRWACPLAVVNWTEGTPTVLEECRNPFDNLVDLNKRFPAPARKWPVITGIGWPNDDVVTLTDFNNGLDVTMSRAMADHSLNEQTFQVVIDLGPALGLPPPTHTLGASDLYRLSFGLRGRVNPVSGSAPNTYRFVPRPNVTWQELHQWLDDQSLREKAAILEPYSRGIRCHVLLDGDAIFDAEGNPLDADTFGKLVPPGPITDLVFPSGDGTEGGKFNSWFFLALPPPFTVTGIIPAKDAWLAPCAVPPAITVTFSDNIYVIPPGITVTDNDGKSVSGGVTFSGNTAIFTPTKLSAPPSGLNAKPFVYRVTVHGDQIKDVLGGFLGTDYVSQFTIQPFTGIDNIAIAFIQDRNGVAIGYRKITITLPKGVHLEGVVTGTSSTTLMVDKGVTTGTVSVKGLTVIFIPDSTQSARALQRRARTGVATTAGSPPPVVHTVTLNGADITDANGCRLDGAGTGVEGTVFTSTFTVYPPKP
jgi:hypothetical protein